MAERKPLCECGGSATTHREPEEHIERCWCPKCLALPKDQRCTEYRPREVKPKVDDNRGHGVRGTAPWTSHAASAAVLPRTGTLRRTAYDTIARRQGRTCDELERDLGRKHQSVSATLNSLHADRLIRDSGQRRETEQGHDAIVWVVVGA